MKRLLIAGMLAVAALVAAGLFQTPPVARSLPPDAIAALEREICEGLTLIQAFTAVVPMNLGSPMTSLTSNSSP